MIGRVGMCRGHEPEFLKDVIWIVKDRVAPEAGFITVGKASKGLQRPPTTSKGLGVMNRYNPMAQNYDSATNRMSLR